MEVQRSGSWVSARVSRAPTDERPNDGSFRVKFDSVARRREGPAGRTSSSKWM